MQRWIDQHLTVILPVFCASLWAAHLYHLALVGGWRLLAKRFRMEATYRGKQWSGESVTMGDVARYRGCLTVGADPSGLFLRPFIFFRFGHAPLFVPWAEIALVGNQRGSFFNSVGFHLGRKEQVPLVMPQKACR
jgi:hypothetical protein